MQNPSCSICIGHFEPQDEISSTTCGHIFHKPCLTQWLGRSTDCPHCRGKLSADKILPLFFNYNDNDTIREDPASLQMRLDLQAQLEMTQKNYEDIIKERNSLKETVARMETVIAALQDHLRYLEIEVTKRGNIIENYEALQAVQVLQREELEKALQKNLKELEETNTLQATEVRQHKMLAKTLQGQVKELEAAKTRLEKKIVMLEKTKAKESAEVASLSKKRNCQTKMGKENDSKASENVVSKPISKGKALVDSDQSTPDYSPLMTRHQRRMRDITNQTKFCDA